MQAHPARSPALRAVLTRRRAGGTEALHRILSFLLIDNRKEENKII